MWHPNAPRLTPPPAEATPHKPGTGSAPPWGNSLGDHPHRLTFGSVIGDIFQPTHLLFVLVVALLFLGPKRLPEVGRALGRGIRDFRNALSTDELREHMISVDDLTGSSTAPQSQSQASETSTTTETVTVPVAQHNPVEPETSVLPSSNASTPAAETAGASPATDRVA